MRIIAAAIAAFSLSTIAAKASDSWSGYYGGLNVGYALGNQAVTEVTPGPGPFGGFSTGSPPLASGAQDINGFFGGIHFGQRRGFNSGLVWGAEIDLGYLGASERFGPVPTLNGDDFIEFNGGVYGTARLNIGLSFGSESQFLAYGTGGAAFLNAKLGFEDISGVTVNAIERKTFSGFAFGGGIEWQANPVWSVKAEYLRMDFGSVLTTGPSSNSPTQEFRWENDVVFDTVALKVSRKF